jgi:hypothetical protein
MKIHPVGANLFHTDRQTDRQTDMMTLIVTFQNFAIVPKKHERADQMWIPRSLFSSSIEVWCIMSLFIEVKQWIKKFYGISVKQRENSAENWGWNIASFYTTVLLHNQHCPPRCFSQRTKLQQFHNHLNNSMFSPKHNSTFQDASIACLNAAFIHPWGRCPNLVCEDLVS